MDSDDDFDDILPEARIFDNRVDDIWNEKMEGYEGLLSKNEKEVENDKTVESISSSPPVLQIEERRSTRSKRGRKKKDQLNKEESPSKVPRRTSPRKKCSTQNQSKKSKTPEVVSMETLSQILAENTNSLSAVAKKRLQKLQWETDRENRRVQKETEQFLSSFKGNKSDKSNEIQLIDEDEIDLEMQIKIRFKSKVLRVTVGEKEVFESIFKKVADRLELKPTEILLCLGDKNINLCDTPKSLKLKIFHVIDCIPYKNEETTGKDINKLLIKIQSNDSRKKTELQIHKLEKFEELMRKYAELRNLSLENLIFEFDGERIEGSETPSDLDMESGSCIDVRVLNLKRPQKEEKKLTAESFKAVPPNEILEIYDLD